MKESIRKFVILLLIVVGLGVFGLNAFFLFSSSLGKRSEIIYIASIIIQTLVGICTCVMVLKNSKKVSYLFTGLSLILIALMDFFVSFVFSYTIWQWWPVYGLFLSIILLICGIYKYKKLKFGFTIPAITIFCMCGWYTLFSFKIIKIPFMTVVWHLGIAFLFAVAAFLIFFFFLQQNHKELVISDEDSGSFEDETSSVLRVDD